MAVFEVDSAALITAAGILAAGIAGGAKIISSALDGCRTVMMEVKELLGRVDVRTEIVHDEIVRERSDVHEAPNLEREERELSPAMKAAGYGRPRTEPGRGR